MAISHLISYSTIPGKTFLFAVKIVKRMERTVNLRKKSWQRFIVFFFFSLDDSKFNLELRAVADGFATRIVESTILAYGGDVHISMPWAIEAKVHEVYLNGKCLCRALDKMKNEEEEEEEATPGNAKTWLILRTSLPSSQNHQVLHVLLCIWLMNGTRSVSCTTRVSQTLYSTSLVQCIAHWMYLDANYQVAHYT